MLVDTHCHLDFKDFEYDRDEVISRSKAEGIDFILNVGSSLRGTEESIALAERYNFIFASAGVHPHEADNITDKELELFRQYTNQERVVAVGEIGLDYYKNISPKDKQKKLFIELLEIAKEKNLPVIIHNRDAHQDVMDILKDVTGPVVHGVMHCFSGERDFLNRCLDVGMYISFTCNITFKKADRLREIAKFVPLDRLLLETDSPFLAPQVFRGQRNEPRYVKYLARELARIKNVNFEDIARVTTENARKLFNIV